VVDEAFSRAGAMYQTTLAVKEYLGMGRMVVRGVTGSAARSGNYFNDCHVVAL